MENLKTFQNNGKLKNLPEGCEIEKSSRKMEYLKIFQKDEKLNNANNSYLLIRQRNEQIMLFGSAN